MRRLWLRLSLAAAALALRAVRWGLKARTQRQYRAAFDAGGYHYSVEHRESRLIHLEQKFDAGQPVASVEAAVAYALGSGERGYSFLVERDGFVAQSPVAWYAQERRYDIAPGYHERNFHFERVILPGCLFLSRRWRDSGRERP